MAMVFYTASQFPAEYQNDAFVAMRGSWNRSKPSGYKVVRVHFENGQPARFDDFLTGFLINNDRSHFARLVGLAVNRDGSLLVSDDTNGVIYRVARQ
jgi:glucose/arabinose dehydrogenase